MVFRIARFKYYLIFVEGIANSVIRIWQRQLGPSFSAFARQALPFPPVAPKNVIVSLLDVMIVAEILRHHCVCTLDFIHFFRRIEGALTHF